MKYIFTFLGILAVSALLSAGCISDDKALSGETDITTATTETGGVLPETDETESDSEPVDAELVEFGDLI